MEHEPGDREDGASDGTSRELPGDAPRRESGPPAEPSTRARVVERASRHDAAVDDTGPDAIGRARDALALAEMLHWFG